MAGPSIALAADAFQDPALAADFADRAELRWADLSTVESVRRTTAGAAAVVVTLQRLTAPIIDAFADSVRVIGRAGVGLDTIDLPAARAKGVDVFNLPVYGAAEVATHALALLLAVHRRLVESDAVVRAGWTGDPQVGRVQPIDEATVGVVGCGRIGREFARRVLPVAGAVVAFDPATPELPAGVERADRLDDLLARSDAISLHLPLTPLTRRLIGMPELKRLRPGAIVVNVARGGILEETELAELLRAGHLGGAGLDVFADEPLPADSPLLAAPHTILTPHCAAASARAAYRLSHWTISDAVNWLTERRLEYGSLVVEGARPER